MRLEIFLFNFFMYLTLQKVWWKYESGFAIKYANTYTNTAINIEW